MHLQKKKSCLTLKFFFIVIPAPKNPTPFQICIQLRLMSLKTVIEVVQGFVMILRRKNSGTFKEGKIGCNRFQKQSINKSRHENQICPITIDW